MICYDVIGKLEIKIENFGVFQKLILIIYSQDYCKMRSADLALECKLFCNDNMEVVQEPVTEVFTPFLTKRLTTLKHC